MPVIYRVTCLIDGASYIGLTIRNPRARWTEHRSRSKTIDRPLYRAMREHGLDNFHFEVIASAEAGEIERLESWFIEKIGTLVERGGYNIRSEAT